MSQRSASASSTGSPCSPRRIADASWKLSAAALQAHLEALQRLDADVLGPQLLGAQRQLPALRQRRGEVDQRDRPPVGAAHERRHPRDAEVRVQAEARVYAEALVGGHGVEVPALVPQLLRAGLVGGLVLRLRAQCRRAPAAGLRKQLERVEVEHLLGVARERDEEHLVAPLCALHEHRRSHRHQHAEERLAAVALPALLPAEAPDAVLLEPLVVLPQQLRARGRGGPRVSASRPRK